MVLFDCKDRVSFIFTKYMQYQALDSDTDIYKIQYGKKRIKVYPRMTKFTIDSQFGKPSFANHKSITM